MTSENSALDDSAKLAALESLLAQPGFRASQRNKNFLRFIVEETLAGRSDRLKAYTIAVDVFGRGSDFDGTLDPVVRIEAGRLRHALARYYADQGQSERIRIALPRGGYIPIFELAEGADPSGPPAAADARSAPPAQDAEAAASPPRETPGPNPAPPVSRLGLGPAVAAAIVVALLLAAAVIGYLVEFGAPQQAPLQQPIIVIARAHPLSADAPSQLLASTLSRSLPAAIARFEGMTVVTGRADQPDGELMAGTLAREPASRRIYLVTAGVSADAAGGARALWQLLDGRTQALLWSSTATAPTAQRSPHDADAQIAQAIAGALASGGVISALELRAVTAPAAAGYPCVAYARAFGSTLGDADRRRVADCLEDTVAASPDYAEAWSMLAFLKNDESRGRIDDPATAKAALARAAAAAGQAERLAPFSALAQMAVAVVAFQQRDLPRFESAARRAIALNPNDPDLQAVFAMRLFATARYDEAMAVSRNAREIRQHPIPKDEILPGLELYRTRRYGELAQLFDRHRQPHSYVYWLLLAAANGQLGNRPSATEQIRHLLEIRPDYGAIMREDMRNRGFQEEFIDHLAEGLRRGGLDVR